MGKGKVYGRECLCGKQELCQGVAAAFHLMQDPRRGYAKLPKFYEDPKLPEQMEINHQREAYLRHLKVDTDKLQKLPRDIALHHFHPTVVLRAASIANQEGKPVSSRRRARDLIPKTITEEEMMHLEMKLDDADMVLDEDGNPTGEYFFVPSYSIKRAKKDLKRLVRANRITLEFQPPTTGKSTKDSKVSDKTKKASITQEMGLVPVALDKDTGRMKPTPALVARAKEQALLRSWEEQRREDYEVVLEQTTYQWESAIILLEEGIETIARAERMVIGASTANQAYADAMQAIYNDVFIDDDGNSVMDVRRQQKLMDERVLLDNSVDVAPNVTADHLIEAEKKKTMLSALIQSKSKMGDRFAANADYGAEDVARDLTALKEELGREVRGMSMMGENLLREMEDVENEVQLAFEALDIAVMQDEEEEEEPEPEDPPLDAGILLMSPSGEEMEATLSPAASRDEGPYSLDPRTVSRDEGPYSPKRAEQPDLDAGILLMSPSGDEIESTLSPCASRDEGGKYSLEPRWLQTTGSMSPIRIEEQLKKENDSISPLKMLRRALTKEMSKVPKSLDMVGTPTSPSSMRASSHDGPEAQVIRAIRKLGNTDDVWVVELLYRAAAKHEARVWELCLRLLSQLHAAVKDLALEREVKLHSMLLDFLPRERRMFMAMPKTHQAVMDALVSLRKDREAMDKTIEDSITIRSRLLLRSDHDRRSHILNRNRISKAKDEQVFDSVLLREAFDSVLLRNAKVVERKVKNEWRTVLAVITADYYLHLFDLSAFPDVEVGSPPEEAYHKLLPENTYGLPSAEDWQPRRDRILKSLLPVESLNLLNCASYVSFFDERLVELTETRPGMFKENAKRKHLMNAKDRQERDEWFHLLERRPAQEIGPALEG